MLDPVTAPGADGAATVAAAREQLRAALPAALVPATFTVFDELPLNANRKVDRKALPVPALAESDDAGLPRTARDAELAALYVRVLITRRSASTATSSSSAAARSWRPT
ncbi:hypothetical protein [Streptomyces sp. NPDC046805]|uniref:hypothetical protein n=1 Tax=Streptomyces sp. NPDC046805 TaxID=3155134 RepID=UPI00340D1432